MPIKQGFKFQMRRDRIRAEEEALERALQKQKDARKGRLGIDNQVGWGEKILYHVEELRRLGH